MKVIAVLKLLAISVLLLLFFLVSFSFLFYLSIKCLLVNLCRTNKNKMNERDMTIVTLNLM